MIAHTITAWRVKGYIYIYITAKKGWLFQLYSGYPSCRDSGYVSLSKLVCSFNYTV